MRSAVRLTDRWTMPTSRRCTRANQTCSWKQFRVVSPKVILANVNIFKGDRIAKGDRRTKGNRSTKGDRVISDSIAKNTHIAKGDRIAKDARIAKGDRITKGDRIAKGDRIIIFTNRFPQSRKRSRRGRVSLRMGEGDVVMTLSRQKQRKLNFIKKGQRKSNRSVNNKRTICTNLG
jgi:hypothetical protein